MENEMLMELEVAPGAVASLAVTSVVLFLLPVVFVLLWKRRCGNNVSFAPLLFGAAGFLVSARVLELGVHMICIVQDNPISRFINGSTPAYVLYGIFMAGIFEECGRYVVIRFIMKKHRSKEDMVMYGIGHGGIEVWAVILLSVVSMLVVDVTLKTNGMESALQMIGVTENATESVRNSAATALAGAAGFDAASGAIYVFERICAMLGHIAFTVLVAYSVTKSQKKYLLMAVLTHAVMDVVPALFQRGVVSIWVTELWCCACAVILVLWSRRLYRKM